MINLIFAIITLVASKKETTDIYILQDKPQIIIGCGGFLVAGQFIFTNAYDSSKKIGVILCPDGYGDNFFTIDKKYKIDFSADSVLPKRFSYMNEYFADKANKISLPPKRLVKEIIKVE